MAIQYRNEKGVYLDAMSANSFVLRQINLLIQDLNEQGSFESVFASRGDAVGSDISSATTAIMTLGYTTDGDGGGAIYIHASGTTVGGFQSADGQWWQLADQVLNVKMFGARGDAVTTAGNVTTGTDDTTAINAAFAYVRAQVGGTQSYQRFPVILEFAPGRYRVSSINATLILGRPWSIHAKGAEIIGTTANLAVLDLLGSRFCSIYDLEIRGDSVNVPSTGIQIGYSTAGTSAGHHTIHNVRSIGNFAKAACYNGGSEQTKLLGCEFRNAAPSGVGCALDGFNHWAVTSNYAPVPSTDVAYSFLLPVIDNCGFLHEAAAVAIWIGSNVGGANFVSCYANTTGDTTIEIYFNIAITSNFPQNLWLNVVCEGNALQSSVKFTRASNSTPQLNDFKFLTDDSRARAEVFECSDGKTGTIVFSGAEISIATFSQVPTNGLFNDQTVFRGDGTIISKSVDVNALKNLPGGAWQLFVGDALDVNYPIGSYAVQSNLFNGATNSELRVKGATHWYGTTAAATGGAFSSDRGTKIDGTLVWSRNFYTEDITLADDHAGSITIPVGVAGAGGALVAIDGNSVTDSMPRGLFAVRSLGGAACTNVAMVSTTNVDFTTGILADGAGTDGKTTLSAHTDGNLYISNRAGGSRTYVVTFLSAV